MKVGDYYYFWHNSGLQNQMVLYKMKNKNSKMFVKLDEAEVFLDPNTLVANGTASVSDKDLAWSSNG